MNMTKFIYADDKKKGINNKPSLILLWLTKSPYLNAEIMILSHHLSDLSTVSLGSFHTSSTFLLPSYIFLTHFKKRRTFGCTAVGLLMNNIKWVLIQNVEFKRDSLSSFSVSATLETCHCQAFLLCSFPPDKVIVLFSFYTILLLCTTQQSRNIVTDLSQ